MGLFRLKFFIEEIFDSIFINVLNSSIHDPFEAIKRYGRRYDYIGISTTHATLENDLELSIFARKYTNARIIFGGIEATHNFKQIQEFGEYDYIVRGEGELPLCRILEDGVSARIIDGELNEELYNLVNLGYNFKLMGYEECWQNNRKLFNDNKRVFRLVTESRCPKGCVFCSSTNLPIPVKVLSAKALVKLIDRAHTCLKPDMILLQGDNFLLGSKGKKRLAELCEMNWRSPAPLMIQTDCRDVLNIDINMLKKIGVTKVSLGVENFSDSVLQEYGKKGQNQVIINRAIDLLLMNQIDVFANMILFSPQMDKDDLIENIRWIKYWLRRGVEFGINIVPLVLPGSKYHATLGKIGVHEPETVSVLGVQFEKTGKLYPEDDHLREIAKRCEERISNLKLPSEELSLEIVKYIEKEVGN